LVPMIVGWEEFVAVRSRAMKPWPANALGGRDPNV